MHNLHMLSRMGACAAFLLLVKFCAAQSEIVLFTHTGWTSEENSGWAPQPKMLDEDHMTRAFQHLQHHALTDVSTVSSAFSGNSRGDLAYDFELVESLVPGFHESTYPIGGGLRLFVEPSHQGQAIYHESLLRPDGASFAGFRSIETLRYSTEKGLTKTVHRVFPMESVHSTTHGLDQAPLTSAIGHCDCVLSGKSFRKKQVRFQEDVVVDVPFGTPYAERDIAYKTLLRDILGDLSRGQWTAVEYSVPAGVIPTLLEREEIPFTMKLYDEWGEVIGTKDTVLVTPRVGDEFGEVLSREGLREAMIDHYVAKQYDDYGEVVGTVDMENNIHVHNIAGMRFYETWYFLEGQPCPRKQINRIVLLRGQWDVDGEYQGLAPLSFALLMR